MTTAAGTTPSLRQRDCPSPGDCDAYEDLPKTQTIFDFETGTMNLDKDNSDFDGPALVIKDSNVEGVEFNKDPDGNVKIAIP